MKIRLLCWSLLLASPFVLAACNRTANENAEPGAATPATAPTTTTPAAPMTTPPPATMPPSSATTMPPASSTAMPPPSSTAPGG